MQGGGSKSWKISALFSWQLPQERPLLLLPRAIQGKFIQLMWKGSYHWGWKGHFYWERKTSTTVKKKKRERQRERGEEEEERGRRITKDLKVFPKSPSQFVGFHSFPINILTLTEETFWGWEFNFCYNSANWRMKFWVWFSDISALYLVETRPYWAHLGAFHSSMQYLYWEVESLSSSYFFQPYVQWH